MLPSLSWQTKPVKEFSRINLSLPLQPTINGQGPDLRSVESIKNSLLSKSKIICGSSPTTPKAAITTKQSSTRKPRRPLDAESTESTSGDDSEDEEMDDLEAVEPRAAFFAKYHQRSSAGPLTEMGAGELFHRAMKGTRNAVDLHHVFLDHLEGRRLAPLPIPLPVNNQPQPPNPLTPPAQSTSRPGTSSGDTAARENAPRRRSNAGAAGATATARAAPLSSRWAPGGASCGRHRMNLSHYGVGDVVTVSIANTLSIADYDVPVHEVNVDDNRITSRGCAALVRLLERRDTLTHLDVAHNRIGRRGCELLADVLATYCSLQHLSLFDNALGGPAARLLAVALTENKTLKSLNLGKNKIDDVGATAIAAMLVRNSVLHTLELSWNHIRGKAASDIATALGANRALQVLDVSWNGFADAQRLDLARALELNSTLTSLDLTHNRVTESTMLAMWRCLRCQASSAVRHLRFDGNPIGVMGARFLLRMVAEAAVQGRTMRVGLHDCDVTNQDGMLPFNPWDPSGRHVFRLKHPSHRAAAHAIIQVASETDKGSVQKAVLIRRKKQESEDEEGAEDDEDDGDEALGDKWVEERTALRLPDDTSTLALPYRGRVEFDVVLPNMPRAESASDELIDALLQSCSSAVDVAHLAPVLMSMVRVTCAQVVRFLDKCAKNDLHKVDIVVDAWAALADPCNAPALLRHLKASEQNLAVQRLGQLYYLTATNLTAHYVLDLSHPPDRAVALTLQRVGAEEKARRGMDTSQSGNGENVRNERYNGDPLAYSSHWVIPTVGTWEFDYVSTTRPPADAAAMCDSELAECIEQIERACPEWWDAVQCQRILKLHKDLTASGPWPRTTSASTPLASNAPASAPPTVPASSSSGPAAVPSSAPPPSAPPVLVPVPRVSWFKGDTLGSVYGVGAPDHDPSTHTAAPPGAAQNAGSAVPGAGAGAGGLGGGGARFDDYRSKLQFFKQQCARLRVLRSAVSNALLTTSQVLQLLPLFEDPLTQVECAVCVFSRVLDLDDFFPTVLGALPTCAVPLVVQRLGLLNIFNPLAARGSFVLDLSNREDRALVAILAAAAPPSPNTWIDTHVDSVPVTPPATWQHDPPLSGIVRFRYEPPQDEQHAAAARLMRAKTLLGTQAQRP